MRGIPGLVLLQVLRDLSLTLWVRLLDQIAVDLVPARERPTVLMVTSCDLRLV